MSTVTDTLIDSSGDVIVHCEYQGGNGIASQRSRSGIVVSTIHRQTLATEVEVSTMTDTLVDGGGDVIVHREYQGGNGITSLCG